METYWRPIYGYLRRSGRTPADAEDLTQGFLARLLERNDIERYDEKRARFRTWIRLLLDRFVANQSERESRQKRGGHLRRVDVEAVEEQLPNSSRDSAEQTFDREWRRSIFGLAVERLERELRAAGKERDFRVFERYDLAGPTQESMPTYAELAREFDGTVGEITNLLHRVRRRLRSAIESILLERCGSAAEAQEELLELLGDRA